MGRGRPHGARWAVVGAAEVRALRAARVAGGEAGRGGRNVRETQLGCGEAGNTIQLSPAQKHSYTEILSTIVLGQKCHVCGNGVGRLLARAQRFESGLWVVFMLQVCMGSR